MKSLHRRLLLAAATLLVAVGCSSDPTQPTVTTSDTPDPSLPSVRDEQAFAWRQLPGLPNAGGLRLSTTAYAPGGRYIYAGAFPDYGVGRLFRFDLRYDRWSEVVTTNWPNGKYRQFVVDEVNSRLITIWDGLGQAWAVPLTGGAWYPIGAAGEGQEYYEGYTFWNPRTKATSRFAGYGFGTFKNTLWQLASDGNWSLIPTTDPKPSPRFGTSAYTINRSTLKAYFAEESLGGFGLSDDLWELDLTTLSWRNLIPRNGSALPRVYSSLASLAPLSNDLIRFGGQEAVFASPVHFDDVLMYRMGAADYVRVPTSGTAPKARRAAGMYFDAARRRLVVLGGADAAGGLDDVWELKVPRLR